MKKATLSILIPVHQQHKHFLQPLLDYLFDQVRKEKASRRVYVYYWIDSGQLSTGAKRQNLLEKATEDYVVSIDVDDWVAPYYIKEMLKAIDTGCDCVAINGTYTKDKDAPIVWYLSKDNPNQTVYGIHGQIFLRTTNHITAVKRKIALKGGFPDKSNGEDAAYSEAIKPYLKTEAVVSKPMYEYRFVSFGKLYK